VLNVISLVPQFAFYRGLYELAKGVQNGRTGIGLPEIGTTFPDGNYCYMGEVIVILFVEWIVYLILAVYLDLVLPSPIGVKIHPLFPLHWLRDKFFVKKVADTSEFDKIYPPEEGEDVKAERDRTYNNNALLRILNLNKTFPPLEGMKEPHTAVHCLSFSVESGSCFGFLGSNGAGKSTTCNMLCGYFGPTKGTARVLGKDIRTEIDEIHQLLGVCPQGDVIWEDLTGREHLQFYGQLKGLTGKDLKEAVDYRLSQVDLMVKGDVAAGSYSGLFAIVCIFNIFHIKSSLSSLLFYRRNEKTFMCGHCTHR
jgi:ABC-type multidrug transport system fused ATPase/permease subunit